MKKLLSILFCIATLPALALTPFYFSAYNADGTPQTNQVLMRAYPPTAQGFTERRLHEFAIDLERYLSVQLRFRKRIQ